MQIRADMHYVSLDGHAVSPYTNWHDAATNLYPQCMNDAAVVAGDTIVVSNGVYTVFPGTYALANFKQITITSLYGAASTILDGGGAAAHAMYNSSAATTTIFGLTVSNWNGSAVRLSDRSPGPGIVLIGCKLAGNLRGIDNVHGAVWATNCIICDNRGYGVYAGGWNNELDNCTISGNSGGVYAAASGMILRGCDIRCNALTSTAQTAGGVYVADAALNCRIENCTIVGNESFLGTGGVRMGGASTIRNCLVACNIATGYLAGVAYAGVGGVNLGSGGTMWNCTVVSNWGGNYAASPGGVGGANGTSYNSIVYFNQSYWAPAYSNHGNGVNIAWTNCCTAPMPSVQSMTTNTNPLFANFGAGNFRPRRGSPCVNSGLNDPGWMSGATDLDGRNRIREAIVDMGAYELIPTGTIIINR